MKALTLWQPWASLVVHGVKTIETRSWSTDYRGPLAIHAAGARHAVPSIAAIDTQLPLGCVIGMVDLVDVQPTDDVIVPLDQLLLGDFTRGRFAWMLRDAVTFDRAHPAPGRRQLWEW